MSLPNCALFSFGYRNANRGIRALGCILYMVIVCLASQTWGFGQTPTPQPEKAPIRITVGQPNVWTMEQAHYLLAQMHRRNLDLRTSDLGRLDANATNAVAIDVLKTAISGAAQFDQSFGVNNDNAQKKNDLALSEGQYAAEQRMNLFRQNTELQQASTQLSREIASLKIQKSRAESEEEKERLQLLIDDLTITSIAVDKQIALNNEQIKALATNLTTTSVTTPQVAPPSGAMSSTLASLATKIADQVSNPPQLNASIKLDNYIQMQYEILSKQLTLLRDEVGPGERIVFMELPQSLNVSNENTKDKWAQSWWKIRGYAKCKVIDSEFNDFDCPKLPQNDRLQNRLRKTSPEIIEELLQTTQVGGANVDGRFLYVRPEDIADVDQIISSKYFSEFLDSAPEFDRLRVKNLEAAQVSKRKLYSNCSKPDPDPEVCPSLKKELTEYEIELKRIIAGIFQKFLDRALMSNVDRWRNISPRASKHADFEEKLTTTNAKDRERTYVYNRRILLEELYPGAISQWKDVSQVIVDLNNADSRKSDDPLWKNYKDRSLRIIDMFPKQGSVNVNDVTSRFPRSLSYN